MNAYVVFLMYLTAILGFVALTLILNRVLGPRPQNSPVKMEPFECGATPVGNVDVKAVPIKYYAVAIIFILFDLETIFLFIWALAAQPLTGVLVADLYEGAVFAGQRVTAGFSSGNLPSGIYFARLSTASGEETNVKLVLQK